MFRNDPRFVKKIPLEIDRKFILDSSGAIVDSPRRPDEISIDYSELLTNQADIDHFALVAFIPSNTSCVHDQSCGDGMKKALFQLKRSPLNLKIGDFGRSGETYPEFDEIFDETMSQILSVKK